MQAVDSGGVSDVNTEGEILLLPLVCDGRSALAYTMGRLLPFIELMKPSTCSEETRGRIEAS